MNKLILAAMKTALENTFDAVEIQGGIDNGFTFYLKDYYVNGAFTVTMQNDSLRYQIVTSGDPELNTLILNQMTINSDAQKASIIIKKQIELALKADLEMNGTIEA